MALGDGACARLPDGTIAHAAHRRIRDGARVALITIPELLRFDVHPCGDCLTLSVRDFCGLTANDDAGQLADRPFVSRERESFSEREIRLVTPDGCEACVVARVPPYRGALENDYSAILLIR